MVLEDGTQVRQTRSSCQCQLFQIKVWVLFGFVEVFQLQSNPVLQLCVINLAEAELERYIILPHNDNNLKLLVKKVKYTTED